MNIISTTDPAERDSCGTPIEIVEAARQALGGSISLDPCSNATAQQIVKAEKYWTIDDDCTKKDWQALGGSNRSLWVNPPYSAAAMRSIVPHIVNNAEAFGAGAIVLVNAVTDTAYGADLVDACDAVVFPRRINFVGQAKGNPHRQMFCIWGCDAAEVLADELRRVDMLRSSFIKQDAIHEWSLRMAAMDDNRRDDVAYWLSGRPTCLEADDFELFCQAIDDQRRGEQPSAGAP